MKSLRIEKRLINHIRFISLFLYFLLEEVRAALKTEVDLLDISQ